MATDQQKVIQNLEKKILDYEKLLEVFTKEEKKIGRVIAGPVKERGMTMYRCQVGETSSLYEYNESIFFKDEKIKEGVEVIILKSGIMGVVPDSLMIREEEPNFKKIDWAEIGGLKSQLHRIRQSIELPLKNGALMKQYGLDPIKGILLWGAPGCGKTLIGKAIASVMMGNHKAGKDAFVYVKGAEMLSMYVGATEQHILSLFKKARKYAEKHGHRAVIFIDEAEALLPTRGSRLSSDVETTIVPTFLSEMDGLDDNGPILILSTNLPNQIDPAILREGRIDIKIEIGRPTKEDAVEIFEVHLKKVKVAEKSLAIPASELLYANGLTHRVSGAMIHTIVKMATQRAVVRRLESTTVKSEGVCLDDIKESIKSLY